jgi:Tol biopolymer transport system component
VPLFAGARLGPYEILSALGAGGMGEVYRARDTRLHRDVALKVLPEGFALDPDRLARFRREAQVLASLNHPNIGAIHGLEETDPSTSSGQAVCALVLELVEGPTLADRIAQGPMPVDEALAIAQQIADALEAAHEQGVVHRDLKPANIKVRPDGAVKVLDFGLAKALGNEAGPSTGTPAIVTNSPTLSMAMTGAGVILGTAAYMAPEQARGKVVDRRADIWAFGVVLYEMLTGKTLFTGETASDTLASVLKEQPDVDRLPWQVRRLLRSCLEKDPRKRLRDIGDMRLLLNEPPPRDDAATTQSSRVRLLPWALAGVFLAAAAAVAFVHFRESAPTPRNARFQMGTPDKTSLIAFRVSPDGRFLAFSASEAGGGAGGVRRLWVRPLDSLEARVLAGTDGAGQMFWSPDSAFLGFFAQGKLKKVRVTGGPPEALCDALNSGRGSWSRDGTIIFAPGPVEPIYRVPAAGGVPIAVTRLAAAESHYTPEFLPDGRRFLFWVTGTAEPDARGIYVGSLDGTAPIRILRDDSTSTPVYAPPAESSRSGHLLFQRENTLMAQPFDPERVQVTGDVFPIAEPVGQFSVSGNGVLAYAYGVGWQAGSSELVWLDRTGKELESAGPPGIYNNFRLSPDEKRIAFDRSGPSVPAPDIWVLDAVRGVTSRLTFDTAADNLPIWSPDGLRVLFPARRGGAFDLYIQGATGAGQEEPLIKMGTPSGWGSDWSQDGRFVLYQRPGTTTGQDLWIAPQAGDRNPFPYLQAPFNEQNGVFSPDGRWIAYVSDESGRNEVYVQAFPLSTEKRQISTTGGSDPAWRKDGTELFYLAADRNLMTTPVKAGGAMFEPGTPKALFQVPGNVTRRSYAAGSTGQRFLVSRPVGEVANTPVTVVMNWQAELAK